MAKAATSKAPAKAAATAKPSKATGKGGGKAPRTHRIAVLPGDGIGEEVVREGLKVLDAVAEIDGKWVDVAAEVDTLSIRLEATDVRVTALRLVWVPTT